MAQVRLELENWGNLDVIDEIVMPFNYNLNDIRDITNRGGAFSKTITIPGTNNNNDILGQAFNVNTNTLTFNPKIKETVRISIDGFNQFEGIFQLRKVRKKYITNEDFKIIYDCFVKSEAPSFYDRISGKFLDELTPLLNAQDGISYPEFRFNETFIEDSMLNGDVSYGYQFYLPYNLDEYYTPQIMIPGIYAKVIWDNIFYQADFEYQFDELEEVDFDEMIIPFQGGKYKPQDDDIYAVRAGRQGFYLSDKLYYHYQTDNPDNVYIIGEYFFEEDITPQVVPYDDDNNNPENWFDNGNNYDTTTSRYIIPSFFAGEITLKTLFADQIWLSFEKPFYAVKSYATDTVVYSGFDNSFEQQYSPYDVVVTIAHRGRFANGSTTILNSEQFTFQRQLDPTAYYVPANDSDISSLQAEIVADFERQELQTTFNVADYPGIVSVENIISVEVNGIFYADDLVNDIYRKYVPNWYIRIFSNPQSDFQAHFEVTTDNSVGYNTPATIETLLPKKIKQTDFILSIIKMFNLYVYSDPIQQNKLIFKTRDRFYEEGIDLDWTEKVDIRSVDIELISNKRKKTTLFTHKDDDKDIVLKTYTETTNEIYGQLEYILENDFVKDVETIETIFSPAVAATSRGRQTPYIDNLVEKNIKIVYVGDKVEDDWVFWTGIPATTPQDIANQFYPFQYYRYAGHFYPNQIEPKKDLNFGICDFYAHSRKYITDNNLFNRFYRTQMDIIENGYIMTAYFNLSYLDVKNLIFNERIYVYDSWWNINKIIDFDMNNRKLTKVELITSDKTIGDFYPNDQIIIGKIYPSFNSLVNESSQNSRENTIGVDVSRTEIKGVNNTIQSNSTTNLIIGDRNNINGENIFVNGSDNKVQGSNINVIGLNKGVFTDPNTVYTGTLIQQVHFIDAGRDKVLDKYPENKVINIIDGGRDEIRPYGSFSIESIVDGGRDRV